ncbi:MAG: peptidoglycan DD-metalloendopeptidase family protein [Chloroflexota bacterium]
MENQVKNAAPPPGGRPAAPRGPSQPGAPKRRPSPKKTANLLQQVGLNMLMVGLLALTGFLGYLRFTGQPLWSSRPEVPAAAAPVESGGEASGAQVAALDPLALSADAVNSITRKTNLQTIIPSRPRVDVITYTVQSGDTLFSIAYNYGIKPETILFGNYDALQDNPHLLKPNQVLNILPVNGAYYTWEDGDTLGSVASTFGVDQQEIIEYPGNAIDLGALADGTLGLKAGDHLIVPGGKRAIRDWGPPAISRSNPAVARYYGEGACGAISSGAVGNGTFVWPTTDHTISGYTYDSGVHPGVDIGGAEGNAIYATDGGVVVYAGWSDYGYGYMIVVDHGTGWQSAYAHLSAVGVTCGQSVFQGGYIGALGNTGNSSGPHLHFELSINGAKVNPLDYVR